MKGVRIMSLYKANERIEAVAVQQARILMPELQKAMAGANSPLLLAELGTREYLFFYVGKQRPDSSTAR